MDKNLIFAFLLSTLVIIVYYLIFPPVPSKSSKPQEVSQKEETALKPQEHKLPKIENIPLEEVEVDGKIITLESDLFIAKINTRGAVLESFVLKNYNYSSKPRINILQTVWNSILGKKTPKREYDPNRKVEMIDPASLELKKLPWEFLLQEGQNLTYQSDKENISFNDKSELTLTAVTAEGVIIKKTFSFDAKNYLVDIDISAFNNSNQRVPINPLFVIGQGKKANITDYQARPTRFSIYYDRDLDIYDGNDVKENNRWENFDWVGMMDIYFVQAIKTISKEWVVSLQESRQFFKGEEVLVPFLEFNSPSKRVLEVGENWQSSFEIFIGPKLQSQMKLFSQTLEESLDLTFGFLGQPMLIALRWFYGIIPNWGIAIILLTILVRLIIFPLTYKGMKSMKRMSALSPKIQALKKKYGDNKEKINKEMIEIYKKQKVSPLGGCLPLILQIPIFIALYSALIPAIELRHSSFIFWVTDLSQPDFLYVLPVLMGLSMYLQQKLTPIAANIDKTQQKIFKFLPVIMTFLFS